MEWKTRRPRSRARFIPSSRFQENPRYTHHTQPFWQVVALFWQLLMLYRVNWLRFRSFSRQFNCHPERFWILVWSFALGMAYRECPDRQF